MIPVRPEKSPQMRLAAVSDGVGSDADVGIGNQPHDNPDWTFAKNASSYPVMKLVVLVRTKQ